LLCGLNDWRSGRADGRERTGYRLVFVLQELERLPKGYRKRSEPSIITGLINRFLPVPDAVIMQVDSEHEEGAFSNKIGGGTKAVREPPHCTPRYSSCLRIACYCTLRYFAQMTIVETDIAEPA
jgi:hypothetical protein